MLNLNPTSLIFGENGHVTPISTGTIADVNYTPHDLTVRVTALPSHGAVLKEDRPMIRRHYPGFLSQADCVQVIDKCLSAPESLKYDIFNAISENKYRWRSTEHTKSVLGWRPTGRSDDFPLPKTP